MKAEKYRKEKKNAEQKANEFKKKRNTTEKCEYLSHLELDEGRKVQERKVKCKTKREKNQKDEKQLKKM